MNTDLRARVRAEAAATAESFTAWLEAADALRIAGVPRKVRRRRGERVDWSRDSAEHDALDLLAPCELDRLRDGGWMTHDDGVGTKGYRADIVLERFAEMYSLGDIDTAWSRWLQATKLIDAARVVAQGRTPRAQWLDGWDWWNHVAPACTADGIDVRAVLAGEDTVRVAELNDAVTAYLDRLVHEPKREYARAYALHLVTGDREPPAPDKPWAPGVRVKVNRYHKEGQAA